MQISSIYYEFLCPELNSDGLYFVISRVITSNYVYNNVMMMIGMLYYW